MGVPAAGPDGWTLPLFRVGVIADVVTSIQACLDHDGTDRLGEIDVPTLVLGGTADHLFPEGVLCETANGIADAQLKFIEGAGHAAFEERKRAFDAVLGAFCRR